MLNSFINFIKNENGTIMLVWTIVIFFITIILKLFQYIAIKKNEYKQQNYKNYHQLITDLNKANISLYRQVAIIYELRNFPRYFTVTKRILQDSFSVPKDDSEILFNIEAEKTIEYINSGFFKKILIKTLKLH